LLDEALSISREFGRSSALALSALGWVRFRQGDLVAARTHLTEALEVLRAFGVRRAMAQALQWIGMVSHAEGDIGSACMQLREALAIHHAMGHGLGVASALDALAALSLANAAPTTAARLWGRAQRLREEIRDAKFVDTWRDAQIAAARRALQDNTAFDRAWDEGRSWTLDEAIRHAMEI
jgi:tetratricopeptide (TPR) repeat protein